MSTIQLTNIDMDINDVGTLACSILRDEVHAVGIDVPVVIWEGEKNAYLDGNEEANETAYAELAAHYRERKHELGVFPDEQVDNEQFVTAALYTRYEILCGEIVDALKEQTLQSKSLDSEVRMFFWRTPRGWCGFLRNGRTSTARDERGPLWSPYEIQQALRDLYNSKETWW